MSEILGKSASRKRRFLKSGQVSPGQESNGQRPSHFVIGRSSFGKISAVEGISPTAEALARAREFDRAGLSPEERRKAIVEAYRDKP